MDRLEILLRADDPKVSPDAILCLELDPDAEPEPDPEMEREDSVGGTNGLEVAVSR